MCLECLKIFIDNSCHDTSNIYIFSRMSKTHICTQTKFFKNYKRQTISYFHIIKKYKTGNQVKTILIVSECRFFEMQYSLVYHIKMIEIV